MKNKIFTRIIITTLLCAFLTLNVGKVTRVSAVGTTAAIAGTAFILTGAVYLSYVALTQGEMILPAAAELHDWLGGIGRKVSQYPSGSAAYQEIYQDLVRSPVGNLIDDVWTWSQDKIKLFANDFASTEIISNILEFTRENDVAQIPTNGFTYSQEIITTPQIVFYNGMMSFADYAGGAYSITYPTGPMVMLNDLSNTKITAVYSDFSLPVRNYKDGDRYYAQYLYDGNWINFVDSISLYIIMHTANGDKTLHVNNDQLTFYEQYASSKYLSGWFSYPVFPHEVIFDSATQQDLPMVVVDSTEIVKPSWTDPDNDNRPIIPWIPLPDLPVNVNPPSGYVNPQWGFNLQDLLDTLEDLASQLIDISAIASLINEFAGLHGDNYYIEYNDGDTNYYTYYQPAIYDNDTQYITYNINVSEEEDTIPVNLNTISQYSNNRYLEQIKRSAVNGSSIIRDLAVFWYDVDPEVTYIALGICIIILLGAFTGKLGHS